MSLDMHDRPQQPAGTAASSSWSVRDLVREHGPYAACAVSLGYLMGLPPFFWPVWVLGLLLFYMALRWTVNLLREDAIRAKKNCPGCTKGIGTVEEVYCRTHDLHWNGRWPG